MKLIATNKKASFDYFLLETIEAGIVLVGSEVKSIRLGNVNLKDTFIVFDKNSECYLKNMYIKTYDKISFDVPDERRSRKLLLNKREINKLMSKVKEKGFTVVPTKLYFKDNKVKVEIALAKGKHTYDKKETLQNKDIERDMQRQIKRYS
ncbi:MAG: SsrA-binding protein SmpB [Clostridia bacterium]|nr:SsrA-binding protein SmpB [Clostridia bacterium]